MRLASLPMYDEVEVRPATARWWTGLARHLSAHGVGDVPEALGWPDDLYVHWRTPGLLFSQTCGYPLVHMVAGDVQLVATPHYDTLGCEGPRYASHVLVREDAELESVDELRGRRLAVNGFDSYSGYHMWPDMLSGADRPDVYFGEVMETGSHRQSVRSVREGEADVCAVDCVGHALLQDWNPDELTGLRTLCTSLLAPSLPFVTSAATPAGEVSRLREGLFAALADPALAAARGILHLAGASVLTEVDYEKAFGD